MTNAVNLASAAGTGFAFRNRLINGDMRIDQRTAGASTSIAVGDGVTFLPDRWRFQKSSSSYGSTAQLSSTAPEGFTSSLLVTVTSAFSPAAGDYFTVGQKIEGFNYADFQFGSPVAKPVTISFWVRSSVTGSYAVSLSNANVYNRFIVKTITINSANTWEYKTLTFPGDTTGTWGISSSDSLYLRIDLGSGSSFNATAADAWSSAGFRLSSTSNFASNAGATFHLAGAQLEIGSVATQFERRPYGLELALCQRYYTLLDFNVDGFHSFYGEGATNSASTFFAVKHQFPATMRATPTFVSTATFTTVLCSAVANLISPSSHVTQFGASNSANNRAYAHISSGKMTWSAEL